jgi:hypothetical protein
LSILALIASAVVAQASVPAPQEITTSDPIALFNGACLGDQVELSKQAFAPVGYKGVPAGAKEALAFSLMMETDPKPGAKALALPDSQVPNGFYAMLPSRKVFLMVPGRAGAGGPVAPQCGVIWKGDHYAEALKAAKAIRPIPQSGPTMPDRAAMPGFGFEVIRADGAVIGVAEDGDWTVLRIAADTSPQDQSK